MYANAPVKMLIPAILDVLSRYTDSSRTLTQKEITDILEREYYMKTDRKTVGRNLRDIMEYDSRVHALTEIPRTITDRKTGEVVDTTILNDFYMDRLFDDTEIQILIYNVVFSKDIPSSIKRSMVKRLCTLGNKNADIDINTYAIMPDGNKKDYNELFLNLELLAEAISEHKKVTFKRKYRTFNESVKTPAAPEVLSPFKIGREYGRYTVCGYSHYGDESAESGYEYGNVTRITLDRMTDIEITDDDSIDVHDIKGIGQNFDYNAFLTTGIGMHPAKTMVAKFDIKKLSSLTYAVEWFGEENIISVVEEEPNIDEYNFGYTGGGRYTLTVKSSDYHVFVHAIAPFNGADIVEPEDLRQFVKETFTSNPELAKYPHP